MKMVTVELTAEHWAFEEGAQVLRHAGDIIIVREEQLAANSDRMKRVIPATDDARAEQEAAEAGALRAHTDAASERLAQILEHRSRPGNV